MQTVTVDGHEALFFPNLGGQQLAGGQAIQIGGQPTYITANGQIIRAPAGMMPANILQNMSGQTVQLPSGMFRNCVGLILVFKCN